MALWEKYSRFSTYQRMHHFLQPIIALLLIASVNANATELRPFSSDGCSLFPDGSIAQRELWLDCCQAHDAAYWAGGTLDQRNIADHALRSCVASKGETTLSWLMLMGVNLGGSPFLLTNFRWGFGWPYLRGYQALNAKELAAIYQGWPAGIAMPSYLKERDKLLP